MVAKKYFQDSKYCLEEYFLLVRDRKKRESTEAFKRLCKIFGEERIRKVINKGDICQRGVLGDGEGGGSGDEKIEK